MEYSSDESPDEDNPQPVEGAGAPKRVKKQIHLTLPTNPAHITTTETFATFFINHGLTQALRKAFEKRGWSTDQMGELVANFQKKHGQQVPMPAIYKDEDSSDSEGLELVDGTKVDKKTAGGSRGDDPGWGRKRGRGNDGGDGDDPNKCRKTGMRVDHQDRSWPVKNHAKWAQFTPRLTEGCQSSTSLARRREPCWAITRWTGLWHRRRRYMR